jgi:hypothetical protein
MPWDKEMALDRTHGSDYGLILDTLADDLGVDHRLAGAYVWVARCREQQQGGEQTEESRHTVYYKDQNRYGNTLIPVKGIHGTWGLVPTAP